LNRQENPQHVGATVARRKDPDCLDDHVLRCCAIRASGGRGPADLA
jgi:hypothetical protein